MPVFKKFEPEDQIDNVLILEPAWELASGSSGWRGAPEGSASISLYGGHHRSENSVVREYKFERIIQGTNSFGVLSRSGPITASVNFVYMTNDELSISERTSERWGYEHWKTVMGLYDFYGRRNPDYSTASYDNYCLYFHSSSQNVVMSPLLLSGSRSSAFPTGSFTIESWVKPFSTGSTRSTIQSLNRNFWFGVTGSTGMLVMSGAFGSLESSSGLNLGKWNHVAYSYDSTVLPLPVGTLYINNVSVGTINHDPITVNSFTASLTIGAVWSGTLTSGRFESSISSNNKGMPGTSFHGMIGECRIWPTARTAAQISGTHNTRLTGTIVTDTLAYFHLSEGPLMKSSELIPIGSGVLDQSAYRRSLQSGMFLEYPGRLSGFSDRDAPVWLPNDNNLMYIAKQLTPSYVMTADSASDYGIDTFRTEDVTKMRVISMPAGFYGRSIKRGSVRLTDNAFSSQGLVRTLVDDSRGGLYVSGSMFSSAGSRVEDYAGVEWNKIGNVFYDEGLIVIKDPALLDFGAQWSQSSLMPNDLLQLSFRGDSRVPIKTLMCRIERGDLNASLNSTFWEEEEDGDRIRTNPSGSLYVTTVGLYNSEHELVGVARLAEPLKIRGNNRINIRLRMDF